MAKKEKTTLQTLRGYKVASFCTKYIGAFACPLLPVTVMSIVNWNDWWASSGASLPWGVVFVGLSAVGAVLAILKSDTVFKKGEVGLLIFGLGFFLLGICNLFLAKLFETVGFLFMMTGAGLIGSFTCYLVDEKKLSQKVKFYQDLVDKYALDKKGYEKKLADEKAAKEAEKRAKKEAEIEEARQRAVD